MKKALITFSIFLSLFATFVTDIQVAKATLAQDVSKQISAFAGTDGAGILTAKDPRTIAAQIVKVLLSLVGTVILMYVFYAGYLWMTAGGESEKVDTAKHILKNCTIGTILALSSYSIVVLLGRASGIQQNGVGARVEDQYGSVYMNTEQTQYTGCDAEVDQWDDTQKKFIKVPNPALNDPLNPMCQTGGVKTGPF